MHILSFEKFDELSNQAENMVLPQDYIFPSIDEIREKIKDETYILDALIAMTHSNDKNYSKRINSILTDILYLVDEDNLSSKIEIEKKEKLFLSMEELQNMTNNVLNMNFQCTYWYPSVEEMKKRIFEANETDVYFLLWLINTKMDLTDDEKKTQEYAQKLLKNLVAVGGV